MKKKKLNLIYFSPTETTKTIVKAIADGMKIHNVTEINLTKTENIKDYRFNQDDVVIIGVPVYSGRIPLIALQRLERIKANQSKAILVVVYGNRHYDDALLELKNLTKKIGFEIIAASAFVGVHSYSTVDYPIATDRPNNEDLQLAKNLGEQAFSKISGKYLEINVPGNFPYRERSPKLDVKPKTDLNLCDFCGLCKKVCPVDAITILENKIDIDAKLCIYCHACVKICPQNARIIDDERIVAFSKKLHENCQEPRPIEIFI